MYSIVIQLYIYTHILFQILFHSITGYYKILIVVPCAIYRSLLLRNPFSVHIN